MAESPIPTLAPQESAALEAFLEPGASLAEIAGKLGIGIVELVSLLTSEPVAAALEVVRRVQQMQLEMAQSAAFAAATDALSKLLPRAQDAVEIRRTATAILRSIRPSRARTNVTHRPARTSSPPPTRRDDSPRTASGADASGAQPTSPPPAASSGGFQSQSRRGDGGRAPMECIFAPLTPNHPPRAVSPIAHGLDHAHQQSSPAARLAAAAGISGPAP